MCLWTATYITKLYMYALVAWGNLNIAQRLTIFIIYCTCSTTIVEQNGSIHVPLTWVHSNVYGLNETQSVRYLTAVDPLLSTSSAVQTYNHLTSGFIDIPLLAWWIFIVNSSSIGEEPVPHVMPHSIHMMLATSSLVSHAEQGITIMFTNMLQDHLTVVLVCCISEWEPDISCSWEERDTWLQLPTVLFVA